MRRLLAICSVMLLLTGIAFAQKTDRERDGLKGPVKTVRVRTGIVINENGNESHNPPLLTHSVSYDQAGNRTEFTVFDENGNLSRKVTYEFDPETKKRSGLIVYNSQNSMVRKVSDKFGPNGMRISRTISDFNEDGTLYRRTEITFDSLGDLTNVAQFNADGSPVKNERPAGGEPGITNVDSTSRPLPQVEDRLVTFGQGPGEFFEPDAHGNWTRGKTSRTTRKYDSGKEITKTEWSYREFTYY
jgi:Flagellar basal body protein FlaE